jgi:predicted methyltransferase
MNEDILLGLLVGVAIGAWTVYYLVKIALSRVTSHIKEILQEVEQTRIEVRLEIDKDQFFMYNKETNEFMAQGRTLAELRDMIQKRWPDKSVVYAGDDQEILDKLKATVNENSISI